MSELNSQQIAFLNNYNNPKSLTFGNAYKSALNAGYSEEYSQNITGQFPDWLSENISRQKRIIEKAEKNLDEFMDSEDIKVKADMTKFALSRLKKEDYSDRTEHTGKDGGTLVIELSEKIADKYKLYDTKKQE